MRALLSVGTVLLLLAFGALAGCEGDSLGNAYGPCVTSDDCDGPARQCRTFELYGHQSSWCTTSCRVNSECPGAASTGGGGTIIPVCIGVDASGHLSTDPDSPEKTCAMYCDPTAADDQCGTNGTTCLQIAAPGVPGAAVCAE